MSAAEPSPFERNFRMVLGHFATGVAVVTAIDNGTPVGMTVQSLCSLSIDPPLILLCPGRSSSSWPRIRKAGRLGVNLLGEGQADIARQFAQRGSDKYRGIQWQPAPQSGSPVLDRAVAWIDCELEHEHAGGDHIVAICRVLDLAARTDIRPLVFFRSGFQRLLTGGDAPIGDVRSVILSVRDMDRACRYYSEGLGLIPLFRDGARWATFSGGNFNIALAGSDQEIAGAIAVNIKVPDVGMALERATAAGGTVVEEMRRGPHEIRGAFRDPDGHVFYVYAPLNGAGDDSL